MVFIYRTLQIIETKHDLQTNQLLLMTLYIASDYT